MGIVDRLTTNQAESIALVTANQAVMISKLSEIDAGIDALGGFTDGSEALLAALGTKLDSVVAALSALNVLITATNVALVTVNAKLTAIDTKVGTTNTKLGAGLPAALDGGGSLKVRIVP